MLARTDLEFPYMFWAHSESFRSPYCLAQSGMPLPEAGWLGTLSASEVLQFAAVDLIPRLEARLGELHGVPRERVLVTLGASGAMHLAAARWFGTGSRVVTETPSYEPLRVLPRRAGAQVFHAPRTLESGYGLDPERVAATLAGSPSGHVFLTNPHNPTGAVLAPETLAALGRAAAGAGGVLVACEAYMDYAPLDQRFHAFQAAPNGVTIGTLTKAYGLQPLRVGWMILGEDLAHERERLIDLAYLTWVTPPSASVAIALRALEHLPELIQPIRRIEATARPHLVRWLRETEGIDAHVPPFGILSFPRLRGVDDTLAFARFLAEEHLVDVVPGEYFDAPGHVRVCCGVPEATLVEGLARLTDGLRQWLER